MEYNDLINNIVEELLDEKLFPSESSKDKGSFFRNRTAKDIKTARKINDASLEQRKQGKSADEADLWGGAQYLAARTADLGASAADTAEHYPKSNPEGLFPQFQHLGSAYEKLVNRTIRGTNKASRG